MSNYGTAETLRARTCTGNSYSYDDDLIQELSRTDNITEQNVYLEQLLVRSDGIIDAYLAKNYNTPIVTDASNGFLSEITLAISEYELFKRGMGDDVPTKYKISKDEAMKMLLDIANGVIAPFGGSGESTNSSFDFTTDTSIMNEDELSGY